MTSRDFVRYVYRTGGVVESNVRYLLEEEDQMIRWRVPVIVEANGPEQAEALVTQALGGIHKPIVAMGQAKEEIPS